ncbi:carbohydrate ABC transporter permease [Kushneria phosphatilytica]|uniref:Carbohydrate ABC transporter permease n=1 Tax=Kushneria phosphatilytica TaxID=657387 RepID=A0A1S1NRP7_9GAMM|nr:carbohydrate ABC transporter permease [Kushneria phosphatilytica]OHV07568.1 sugar ABC transporter permease [Kushneria phosphatilytica]QEL10053.1 carbohydrate ABC transporter permease [Kushneria phosphatilytica]
MTNRTPLPVRIAKAVLLAALLLWTLVPIGWMVLSSFKPDNAITANTPQVFFKPTLEHYQALFSGGNSLWSYVFNSLTVAGASTFISVVLGCMAGYGLSRIRLKGKHHLAFWIISTRMAPIAAVIVPLYLLFRYLYLLDTYTGLVIAYLSFNLPFAIWLMTAFFDDLPPDLEEAAMIDGATKWQVFWHVSLPLMKPGLVTTAILCFIFAWNDYSFAQTFAGPNTQTIPIAAAQLLTQTGIDWGKLLAIGTIVVSPMAIFGLLVKRWLVRGLTLGAVK